MNGVEEFKREIMDEDVEIGKKLHEHGKKLVTDKIYNQEFMEPHNCPAHILAVRTRYALQMEEIQSGSGMPAQLLMPYFSPYTKPKGRPISILQILYYLKKFWITEVLEPMERLAFDAEYKNAQPKNCKEADAIANAYYAKRADIYNRGVDRIKKEFINKSDELKAWILLELYATPDYQSNKGMGDAYALVDYLDNKIAKQSVENHTYKELLRFIEYGKEYINRLRSNCDQSDVPDPTQPAKDMKGYKVKRVECEYVKKFELPGMYTFELRCNTMYEKVNPKTKKRLPDIPKGAAEIASPRTQTVGPVSGRGPHTFYDAMYEENKYRPLCLESKEESQFGLEFDKWGKLIACNFQLSEDGTTLKDPDSVESGIDSRWSWNAIASAKKSYLNKLIIK
jgi:hypothetical protein